MALAGREGRANQARRPLPLCKLCLREKLRATGRRKQSIYFFTHRRIFSPMTIPDATRALVMLFRFSALRSSAEILAGAANPYHAACTRKGLRRRAYAY